MVSNKTILIVRNDLVVSSPTLEDCMFICMNNEGCQGGTYAPKPKQCGPMFYYGESQTHQYGSPDYISFLVVEHSDEDKKMYEKACADNFQKLVDERYKRQQRNNRRMWG
uniref:Apple domain-containing protein n=1 Tax=Steinernema glaseri TaxID=37863 RepID=A0A1I8AU60_9BILA